MTFPSIWGTFVVVPAVRRKDEDVYAWEALCLWVVTGSFGWSESKSWGWQLAASCCGLLKCQNAEAVSTGEPPISPAVPRNFPREAHISTLFFFHLVWTLPLHPSLLFLSFLSSLGFQSLVVGYSVY